MRGKSGRADLKGAAEFGLLLGKKNSGACKRLHEEAGKRQEIIGKTSPPLSIGGAAIVSQGPRRTRYGRKAKRENLEVTKGQLVAGGWPTTTQPTGKGRLNDSTKERRGERRS